MNDAFEFHDSHCLSIETDGAGKAVVVLDAYVHRDPAAWPHEGGYQRVRITMHAKRFSGNIGELPTDIYEGSLIAAELPSDMIPLPSQTQNDFILSLMLSNDARVIEIAGRGVMITPEGPFRFLEVVPFGG